MIIIIKSNNNHLLDILYKNPDTDAGLYFKPLKNGHIVGNAVSRNHYEVIFQDTKYSYLPEEANQIDYQSYCSPLVVLHICTELFVHILKSKEEYMSRPIAWLNMNQGEADTENCTIEIPSFYIDSTWFRNNRFLLTKYFPGVEVTKQTACVHRLTIAGKNIFEAFNLLALVSLFTHLTNNYGKFTFVDDSLSQKYGRILTNIDNVPYFVFYLFIMKTIKTEKQFKELKPAFESYLAANGIKAELVMQGTYQERIHFITNLLETDIPILDIGCGELTYYRKMMKKGFLANYYAVDQNEHYAAMAERISLKFGEDNLIFFQSVTEYDSDEKVNILLTEVIEHNSMQDAVDLIKTALAFNFKKIIITTPNMEFNCFYTMDEQFRHNDHCFELTEAEFKEMVNACTAGMPVHVDFVKLGDCLNGITPTQGCIITQMNDNL